MPIGFAELGTLFAIGILVTGITAALWWLAGWATRGTNKRVVVGALTTWVLTTIIGMFVFLAFVSIRKRRARAAATT